MVLKDILDETLRVLKDGGIILYPTDTVWGIGCDATRADSVARIFGIKRRAEAKSMVLLAADLDMVARHVRRIPDVAIDLVEVNDAPMTIVYPDAMGLAPNVIAEDGSVGIRIPRHPFCTELLRRFRRPIVSTSANLSGEPTPENFAQISPEIREAVDYVVDRSMEKGASGRSSQIIKLGLRGEVEIIRA
ncbi:MAG: threonylcarbamoyl-AMP synthase [Bacteroidales bacterium]|nr:threonylcarbamoyl-AMP synthase [Bacteroidales bacterium]